MSLKGAVNTAFKALSGMRQEISKLLCRAYMDYFKASQSGFNFNTI
ncbi:hypothetical protein M901_2330 [Bacteriovorax sp. DB6_IX]|nr:hypothetical protein M901_2330 [Bacteriovorax sp. DB6_IX]